MCDVGDHARYAAIKLALDQGLLERGRSTVLFSDELSIKFFTA